MILLLREYFFFLNSFIFVHLYNLAKIILYYSKRVLCSVVPNFSIFGFETTRIAYLLRQNVFVLFIAVEDL